MALALGKTVRELLAGIDSGELTEWMAYYQLEPFGEMIADQRHGIATSVLANINRDSKQRREPYAATDFIYWHPANTEPQEEARFVDDPAEQSKMIIDALFSGHQKGK